jgi:hypothetical protein
MAQEEEKEKAMMKALCHQPAGPSYIIYTLHFAFASLKSQQWIRSNWTTLVRTGFVPTGSLSLSL